MSHSDRVSTVIQLMQQQSARAEKAVEALSAVKLSSNYIDVATWHECKQCLWQVQQAQNEIVDIVRNGCTEHQSKAMFDHYFNYQISIQKLSKIMYPNTY